MAVGGTNVRQTTAALRSSMLVARVVEGDASAERVGRRDDRRSGREAKANANVGVGRSGRGGTASAASRNGGRDNDEPVSDMPSRVPARRQIPRDELWLAATSTVWPPSRRRPPKFIAGREGRCNEYAQGKRCWCGHKSRNSRARFANAPAAGSGAKSSRGFGRRERRSRDGARANVGNGVCVHVRRSFLLMRE